MLDEMLTGTWPSVAPAAPALKLRRRSGTVGRRTVLETSGGPDPFTPASVFLSNAQNLLDRRLAGARLGPAVFPERDHAAVHGGAPDLVGGRLAEDETADLLADDEQLVNADPALVSGLAARV